MVANPIFYEIIVTLLHYNILCHLWDVKNVYSDSDRLLFVEMLNV